MDNTQHYPFALPKLSRACPEELRAHLRKPSSTKIPFGPLRVAFCEKNLNRFLNNQNKSLGGELFRSYQGHTIYRFWACLGFRDYGLGFG